MASLIRLFKAYYYTETKLEVNETPKLSNVPKVSPISKFINTCYPVGKQYNYELDDLVPIPSYQRVSEGCVICGCVVSPTVMGQRIRIQKQWDSVFRNHLVIRQL